MANFGYNGYFDKHPRERFMLSWAYGRTVNAINAYDGIAFTDPTEQKNFMHQLVKYIDDVWETKEIIGTHHDLLSQTYIDLALYFGDEGELEGTSLPAAEDLFVAWKNKIRAYKRMGFSIDPSIEKYLK